MNIGQLVVRFERDWAPRCYIYLGQMCMMGVADRLLEGYDCKRPVEFSPRYGSPQAQLRMGEVLGGNENAAERFENLQKWTPPPFWVLPTEGWRTARCLQAALTAGATRVGILDIMAGLRTDVDDWLSTMGAAVEAAIRFHVTMVESSNPPADLVKWVERDWADTVNFIREAVEEAGIEITDGSEIIDGDESLYNWWEDEEEEPS